MPVDVSEEVAAAASDVEALLDAGPEDVGIGKVGVRHPGTIGARRPQRAPLYSRRRGALSVCPAIDVEVERRDSDLIGVGLIVVIVVSGAALGEEGVVADLRRFLGEVGVIPV